MWGLGGVGVGRDELSLLSWFSCLSMRVGLYRTSKQKLGDLRCVGLLAHPPNSPHAPPHPSPPFQHFTHPPNSPYPLTHFTFPFSIVLQFAQYAKGLPTISEEDFACILLKHTRTRMSEVIERLVERATPDSKVG